MLRIDVSRLVGLRRERDALSASSSAAAARVREARDQLEHARERLRQARGTAPDQFGQYGQVAPATIPRCEEVARQAETEFADARAAAEIASERAAAASGLVQNCERVAREMGALK
jgi:hypothetical protein